MAERRPGMVRGLRRGCGLHPDILRRDRRPAGVVEEGVEGGSEARGRDAKGGGVMEAKHKVGDSIRNMATDKIGRVTKAEIVARYRVKWDGELNESPCVWFDNELTTYVRPIAVGERVRYIRAGGTGTVRHIENGEACWMADDGRGLIVSRLTNLERIPTEEAK